MNNAGLTYVRRQELRLRGVLYRWSGGSPRWLRPPRLVQIEITRRCDLFCRTCTRLKLPAQEDLSLPEFLRILDALGQIDLLWLSGQGEPLLHPDLAGMIRACGERGIRGTIVHTNGMQLHGRPLEELAGAGLGELRLSIDGGSADDVEYLRDGSDLARVLENAARFVRLSPTPVVIYTVLNRRNARSLHLLPGLAARAGIPRLEMVETVPFRDGSAQREVYDRREYQFASLPRDERASILREVRSAARRHGVSLRVDLHWERTRCLEPMQKLYVDARGGVTPCCRIHHEVVVGNLLKDGLEAVWLGPRMEDWRRSLRRRAEHPRICVERCNLGIRCAR